MPYLLIFGEELVALSCAIFDKWMEKTFLWSELENKQ